MNEQESNYSSEHLLKLLRRIRFQVWYQQGIFESMENLTREEQNLANLAIEQLDLIRLMTESVVDSSEPFEYPD